MCRWARSAGAGNCGWWTGGAWPSALAAAASATWKRSRTRPEKSGSPAARRRSDRRGGGRAWQRDRVDREGVAAWVAAYERAWREGDVAGVAGPFTEDTRYRRSPYEPSSVGHAEVRAFWREDEGQAFTVMAEPDRPVAAVARRWGFPDPSWFARRLRAAYGVSPREWRALTRGRQASTGPYSPAGAPRPPATRSATTREATQACTCPVPL